MKYWLTFVLHRHVQMAFAHRLPMAFSATALLALLEPYATSESTTANQALVVQTAFVIQRPMATSAHVARAIQA